MDKLHIALGQNSYDILFSHDALNEIPHQLGFLTNARMCCIVSQNNIFKHHGFKLYKILKRAGFKVHIHIIPDGEVAKTSEYCNRLYEFLLAKNYDRHSLLVAFGGGVVGDLTGFVAATYMRGIPYIQIPTTLLSSVDSSVGGKTGINFGGVKNIVGSFYQPKLVIINTGFLETLPLDEFKSGLGEVIKYAILDGEEFFADLYNDIHIITSCHAKLPQIIKRCCEIKAKIVEADEKETSGSRMLLNLGHTMGHAVEVLAGFKHGEAVSIGIAYAAKLSNQLGHLSDHDTSRIIEIIKKSGLPWEVPCHLSSAALFKLIEKDKKQSKGNMNWILPHGIGDVRIHSIPIRHKHCSSILFGTSKKEC
ncbi:MAG: 3-dehydroquinate synthase [Clostridia bacterium]|nr:3-dehydroquinate synthase [Clostridia bacterium]